MEWKLDRVRTVSEEEEAIKFIESYLKYDNKEYDTVLLGKTLIDSNIIKNPIKENMTSYDIDKTYSKKWGSYIGIFTSNGFGYTEKDLNGKKIFKISDIAKQFIDNEISYHEFIVTQLCRIQFPKPNGKDYIEYSRENNVKPFILILKILIVLYSKSKFQAWIDDYDIVTYLENHNYDGNYLELSNKIIYDRKNKLVRDVDSYGRDILINKCLSTELIFKEDNKYYLNKNKIDEVQCIIKKHEKEVFFGKKEDWCEFFGGEV